MVHIATSLLAASCIIGSPAIAAEHAQIQVIEASVAERDELVPRIIEEWLRADGLDETAPDRLLRRFAHLQALILVISPSDYIELEHPHLPTAPQLLLYRLRQVGVPLPDDGPRP